MKRTVYILVCWVCDPEGERPLPFESAAARGRWAAEHRAGTGHDQWWCPDIVDADGPDIHLEELMALVRYRPNRRGLRDLLGSTGVQLDLQARAERVAAAAEADYTARPPHSGVVDVRVDAGLEPTSHRARAAVIAHHPGALAIEADRRPLGHALDAAG